MTEELIAQLKARNDRIIRAVMAKAERVCPGSVAMIGITGSFRNGDIHPRSDLDLCIIINDDAGWKVGSCFILGDVAHDIYCTPWSRLEEMARFTDPFVSKLLDLDIVYCPEERHRTRYDELAAQLRARLASPLALEDLDRAAQYMDDAMGSFAAVVLAESRGRCKYASGRMLFSVECAIYLVNKACISRGIKRIPEELAGLRRLPPGFLDAHARVVRADSMEEITDSSTDLVGMADRYLRELRQGLRPLVTGAALAGSYEEIVSNWRNKMDHAADLGDQYLSFMTATSCQHFYEQVHASFAIPRFDLFSTADFRNLQEWARGFHAVMEQYGGLYATVGQQIRRYGTIEEFEAAYLV